MENKIKRYLKEKLANKRQFTTGNLQSLLNRVNPEVSNSTHAWWINKLKNDGFITQIGRGFYTFKPKKSYKPKLSHKAKQFYNKAKKFLPDQMPLVIYENIFVSDLVGMESQNHYIFLHVPKEQLEFFFYDILNLGKRVFIKPNKEITMRYILPFKEAVILYPLPSEMPIIEINGYTILSLEGMIVHSIIFGSEYFHQQGMKVEHAFKIAFDKYSINYGKLLRYASRRDKRKEVKKILEELQVL